MPGASHAVLQASQFQSLLDALQQAGYCVVGPTRRDGAIVYDTVARVEDLPVGWTDEQEGGTYRLVPRQDQALFGYVVGPHSWKQFVHPPRLRLWQAQRQGHGFQLVETSAEVPRYAFLGVRACELQAIAVQDKVFMQGPHIDPSYAARRVPAFIVAVNCGQAGGTCFCVSMQSGPRVSGGFDLALTEMMEAEQHYFVVEVGSERGEMVLQQIPHQPAGEQHLLAVERLVARTAAQMGRHLDTTGIKALLYQNLEHPRWDEVASRCLACGNCTMVCPTCFCTTVSDVTDLSGTHAERWRTWDSCFSLDFSYLHGGSVRTSTKARYRHWLTHKLATWLDQFGTSGCVGCGRCITWCPVAIDLTAEVSAIRASNQPEPGATQES
ncbi:MAG: 4Fe-4S dicluster domain-containing protein [Candidatus Tectimicrobiota bacterium]